MGFWDQSRQPKTFILFLDTGDICRCPMAKGYLGHLLEQAGMTHIEIMTAGVMTMPSILPTSETQLLLKEKGIDLPRYRSTQYTAIMVRKADLILGMTPFHVQKAKRLVPDKRDDIHLLNEYTKADTKNVQISDPMGATLEVYKRVFREICDACEKLMEMDIIAKPKDCETTIIDSHTRQAARPLPKVREIPVRKKREQRPVFEYPGCDDSIDKVKKEMAAKKAAEEKAAKKAAEAAKKSATKEAPAKAPVTAAPAKAKPEATPAKKTAAKAPAKKATAKAPAKKPAAAKPAPAKAPAKKAPAKKAAAKKAPLKKAVAKKAPAKKAPAKKAAATKAPAKKAPAKKAAAKKAPAKKAAAKKPAAKKSAAKKASSRK